MPVAWYADDQTGSSISKGRNAATGATAGYLFGFVVAAAAVGYLAERGQDRNFATSIPAMLFGTAKSPSNPMKYAHVSPKNP